jgi:hypothetical protein
MLDSSPEAGVFNLGASTPSKLRTVKTLVQYCILLTFCLLLQASAAPRTQGFAAKYKLAKTEIKKRKVCLQFIDAGGLYIGSPVSDVRAVFQDDFEDLDIDAETNRLAIVHFVRPKRGDALHPAVWTGWHLSLTYRPDGAVVRYCLSNESKVSSMQTIFEKQSRERGHLKDPGLPTLEPAPKIPANPEKQAGQH